MNRFSRIINVFGMFAAGTLFSQPVGKSLDIYNLINEARSNPKAFADRHSIEINKIQPKFTLMLKKANPMGNIIWDDNLAINCKEKVNGNLNPSYRGSNKMCGTSSGNGSGYYEKSPIYFLCNFYTHVIDEDDLYFGFYINSSGHAYSWGKTCQPSQKYKFEAPRTIDSSMVDFIKINTASNEMYLSQMDKEMIKEINFVRQYPKVYALIVANYLALQSYSWIGITKDEYIAGMELIEELNARLRPNTPSVGSMAPNPVSQADKTTNLVWRRLNCDTSNAFKLAGAESLVLSLWSVPDDKTQELMGLFYQELTRSKLPVPSFAIAQKTMRDRYPTDPISWAGFVLVR